MNKVLSVIEHSSLLDYLSSLCKSNDNIYFCQFDNYLEISDLLSHYKISFIFQSDTIIVNFLKLNRFNFYDNILEERISINSFVFLELFNIYTRFEKSIFCD